MFDFDVRSGHDPQPPHLLAELSRARLLREEFSSPVTRVPRRVPVVIPPSCNLREALALMTERHAVAALVASHGVLMGMLDERELIRRLVGPQPPTGDLPVGSVMTPELDSLLEGDTIAYAVRKLWTLGGRPVPIVRANGTLLGLLETQDVVAWLCDRVGGSGGGPGGHMRQY